MLESWGSIGEQYYCMANDFRVETKEVLVEGADGEHVNPKTNEDVQGFYATWPAVVNYLPKGLDKIFRNLQGIWIISAKLKVITKKDLEPFPQLTSIFLNGNELQTIQPNLFQHNPRLQRIELKRNKIAAISAGVFDSLANLNELYLTGNVCISKSGTKPNEIEELKKELIVKCQTDASWEAQTVLKALKILNESLQSFLV